MPIKNSVNNLIIFFLSFVLVSCKYCSKSTVNLKIDVAFLSKPDFCQDNMLSDNLVKLYEPIEYKKDIGIFIGNVYQFGITPTGILQISDSATDWVAKARKNLFRKKDTYDAVKKRYQDFISHLETSTLCLQDNNSNASTSLNDLIKVNQYTKILILSKNINDTVWNNHKVYKDVALLKQDILGFYNSSVNSKILVIVDPVDKDKGDEGSIEFPPPPPDCADLQQFLLKIATSSSYDQRTKAKDDAVRMFFADKFSVTLKNDQGDIVDEYEMGGEYLDKLVADFHIKDLRIVNCQKNQDKITHIDVVEKRTNDLDIKAE